MSDPRDVILNAIRVLRSRRVRPSDAKIAWFTQREFFMTEETTSETLQELVHCGDIFKVIYKGGTSYRVAPHKLAASTKLLKPAPKRLKFTPTPTDILRPLLSAVAACGGDATKERIAEELTAAGYGHLVERLETLLQKELRVGLVGRKITPSSSPGGRNITSFFITKSAPLALITNRLGSIKSLPPKSPSRPLQEISPMPQAAAKKAPAPFEHLHLHLKRLQQEKESLKGNEASDIRPHSPPVDGEKKLVAPEDDSPPSPSQESENFLHDVNKFGADDKPTSRRGRPRKPPVIYEDLTSFTTKRGRPPKMAATTRGGKAIKRARKVFDPSDASGRRRCNTASSETSSSISNARCDVCGQSSSQNSFEELLICHRCSARAHPSCLGYSTELAVKSRLGPWTCMDCKHCAICNMDHNIGTLIFCDECDRAYHLSCHQPPLEEQPHGSWICFSCAPTPPGQNVYDSLPGLPTPRDSPVPDDESRGSLGSWEHSVFDPRIPNAASWGVDQVIDYFREKGFADHATVFRDQDIDGTALLMLTRSDVLTGLDLKLGPALKIYKQVRILQTRLPNPPLP